MPDDAPQMQRYSRAAIEDFMQRCFVAVGMPSEDAGTVAHFMAESDIMGIPMASSACPAISAACRPAPST